MVKIIKVVRGGSYKSSSHKLQILFEDHQRFKGKYHGFRIVRRTDCD